MENTTADVLVRACEIGAEEGLNFVYAGNLPGRVGRWEHTRCPGCHAPGIFANPRGVSAPSRHHGAIRPLAV